MAGIGLDPLHLAASRRPQGSNARRTGPAERELLRGRLWVGTAPMPEAENNWSASLGLPWVPGLQIPWEGARWGAGVIIRPPLRYEQPLKGC